MKKKISDKNKMATTKYNALTPRSAPFVSINHINNKSAGTLNTVISDNPSKLSFQKWFNHIKSFSKCNNIKGNADGL